MPGRAALAIIAALALALAGAVLWGALEGKRADDWRAAYKAAVAASQANIAATKALREKERAAYQEQAHAADLSYSRQLADARAATADFVRSRRVQPQGDSSPAQPIGSPGAAGVRAEVPADSLVAVQQSDVLACTDATVYALKLREAFISITGDN